MRFPLLYVLVPALHLGLLGGGLATAASPAGPTRSDYVARVEPICKRAADANRGLLRGVNELISRGELRRASPRFSRAATALGQARRRIAGVPRPPADLPRLTRWLELLREQGALLEEMATALQQQRRPVVQELAQRLLRGSKRINNTVVGFDFEHCRLNPADVV